MTDETLKAGDVLIQVTYEDSRDVPGYAVSASDALGHMSRVMLLQVAFSALSVIVSFAAENESGPDATAVDRQKAMEWLRDNWIAVCTEGKMMLSSMSGAEGTKH
jgi:hypothetical protein